MIRDAVYFNALTETIICCAYKVANQLGYGFLEKVYENSMALELAATGLNALQQQSIKVHYNVHVVGDFYVDLIVEDEIVVELKTVKSLNGSHLAQCLNYLKATQKKLGLLINFGDGKVTVKRIVNGFE